MLPGNKRLLLVSIVLLLCVLVLSSCGEGSAPSTSTPTPTPQPTATPQPTLTPQPLATSDIQKTYNVGDTVTFDGWQITVNSVKSFLGSTYSPVPGDVFVEVSLSMKNLSNPTPKINCLSSCILLDSGGKRYQTLSTQDPPPEPGVVYIDGKASIGKMRKGMAIFDVPLALKTFQFLYTPLNAQDQAM